MTEWAPRCSGSESFRPMPCGRDNDHEPHDVGLPPGRTYAALDMAMRWVVKGHPDDNCCDPCRKNLGKLYRNRQSAYSDYPGGKSYIKCVGERYGNHCRCRVVKRRLKE